MKLYTYFRSTSSWRVRIVLAWKGIPHEPQAVNLAPDAREQERAEFLRVSPLGQIPILEWDEDGMTHRLTQSVAIIEYLEEMHPDPPLLPRDPLARARVRQAVEVVNSGIQPLQNVRTLARVRELDGDPERWARNAIAQGLFALEIFAESSGGAYLVGDDITLAEVYLVPQMYNARRFGVDLSSYPRLCAIEARANEHEAFARAHPERQPDAPPASGATRAR